MVDKNPSECAEVKYYLRETQKLNYSTKDFFAEKFGRKRNNAQKKNYCKYGNSELHSPHSEIPLIEKTTQRLNFDDHEIISNEPNNGKLILRLKVNNNNDDHVFEENEKQKQKQKQKERERENEKEKEKEKKEMPQKTIAKETQKIQNETPRKISNKINITTSSERKYKIEEKTKKIGQNAIQQFEKEIQQIKISNESSFKKSNSKRKRNKDCAEISSGSDNGEKENESIELKSQVKKRKKEIEEIEEIEEGDNDFDADEEEDIELNVRKLIKESRLLNDITEKQKNSKTNKNTDYSVEAFEQVIEELKNGSIELKLPIVELEQHKNNSLLKFDERVDFEELRSCLNLEKELSIAYPKRVTDYLVRIPDSQVGNFITDLESNIAKLNPKLDQSVIRMIAEHEAEAVMVRDKQNARRSMCSLTQNLIVDICHAEAGGGIERMLIEKGVNVPKPRTRKLWISMLIISIVMKNLIKLKKENDDLKYLLKEK